jgi:hypothetical protein
MVNYEDSQFNAMKTASWRFLNIFLMDIKCKPPTSEAGEGAQFEIFGIGTFPPLAEPANPKRGNSFRPNQDSAVPAAPRVNIPVSTGADSRLEGSIASRFVQTQPTSPLVPGVLTATLLASCGLIHPANTQDAGSVWRERGLGAGQADVRSGSSAIPSSLKSTSQPMSTNLTQT